jgi:hypothetical protein
MVMEKAPTEGEDNGFRYVVRLLIKHPHIDPARITAGLELPPNHFHVAGGIRTTPTGQVLPGLHKESSWSHSFRVEGNRGFFPTSRSWSTSWSRIALC